jgi:alpha-L-fucosidase
VGAVAPEAARAEYAKLKDQFTADKFDAEAITDLALAAQMRYVNLTTRHHDSFCLEGFPKQL